MRYLFPLLIVASPVLAEPPVIEAIHATNSGATWRFDVTLSHPDTGWDHYADGWRVETITGDILGTRVLAHPHETEQPFTRSLTGVEIPQGTKTVLVRAKCFVDGWSADATEFILN